MAEALLRHQAGERFEAFSAGIQPEVIDRRALEVLEALGVPTEGLHSKSVSAFVDQSFDFVITLCDKAHQECRNLPATTDTIAWDFEDPKTRAGSKSFTSH